MTLPLQNRYPIHTWKFTGPQVDAICRTDFRTRNYWHKTGKITRSYAHPAKKKGQAKIYTTSQLFQIYILVKLRSWGWTFKDLKPLIAALKKLDTKILSTNLTLFLEGKYGAFLAHKDTTILYTPEQHLKGLPVKDFFERINRELNNPSIRYPTS